MTEPTPSELQRVYDQLRGDMRQGFADINTRLDRLVSQDAFQAEQRRVDDRLKALADDHAEERAARIAALKDERQARQEGDRAQQATLDKLTANVRWVAVSILLPIALFVANLIAARGRA